MTISYTFRWVSSFHNTYHNMLGFATPIRKEYANICYMKMKNNFPVITEYERNLPFYVTSAGEWEHQEQVLREHGFPDLQWLQCWKGQGKLCIHDQEYHVYPGQGMLLFPKQKHHYFPVDKPWSVRWVSFNGMYALDLMHSLGFTQCGVFDLVHPDKQLQIMLDLQHLLVSSNPFTGIEASVLVYRLIMNLYQYAAPVGQTTYKKYSDKMAPVFDYIEAHSHESITLQEIAKQLGVSPQHVCLLFQKTKGLRPFEYVNKVRIRKAKALLLSNPDLSVKEIGKRVGYEHTSYFIKLFKQYEKVTPSRFRQIHLLRTD